MTTTKRYSRTPNPYELFAAELRQRGVATTAERLEETAAALRDRRRLDAKADLEHLKDSAIVVKRARRAQAVAHSLWAMSPSSSNRQALAEATAARREATEMLREECLQDQNLFDDVLRAIS
jgi:hypothetical protein